MNKIISISIVFIVFICLIFSVIIGFSDIKISQRIISVLIILSGFINYIASKRNNLLNKIFFCLSLLFCSPIIINLLIDIIYTEKIPALDCEGHLPMNIGFMRGVLIGIPLSIILSIIYIKSDFINSNFLKLLAFIGIIITIMTFFEFKPFRTFKLEINKLKKTEIIYPENC